MIVTEENEKYYLQALRVDFLTEKWERDLYTYALMQAAAWGKKKDMENKLYFSKNHLIDKYNV